jgi:regulatory protein
MYAKRRPSKLQEPDSVEHGYNYALFLLGLRLRTEGEIAQKMKERGYTERVIADVTNQLKTNAYIDDARYAEVLIDNYKQYKTYGYFMIKKKMIEKRLTRELIESSLDEFLPVSDELKIARRYLDKEGLEVTGKIDYPTRQKIAYKLNSRGFRSSVISNIFSGEVPEEE